MPIAPTFPGVYIEEVPSGVRTITGVPTSVAAFVGRALRGPIDSAVTVNSFGDFERLFGGLWADSMMSYAVRDFFSNGGGQAIIVRVADADPDAGAETARITLRTSPPDAAPGDDVFLNLDAASPGAWGNGLSARVDYQTKDPTADPAAAADPELFNLTVTEAGGATEKFMGVSLDPDSPRFLPRVLEQSSALVRAPRDADGEFDVPAANQRPLETFEAADMDAAVAAQAAADAAQDAADAAAEDAEDAADAASAAAAAAAADPGDAALAAAAEDAAEAAEAAATAAAAAEDAADDAAAAAAAAAPSHVFIPAAGGDDGGPIGPDQIIGGAGDTFETDKRGLFALEHADLFNILCLPPPVRGGDTDSTVYQAAAAYCVKRRAMLIVDPPAAWGASPTPAAAAIAGLSGLGISGTNARNAALYFPRVVEADPARDRQLDTFVPCGVVAGVMSRTDTQRGVWKAPAGLDASLNGIQGLQANLNDQENGQLNPLGINCLRSFPVNGRVVWGARTLRGADQLADEYKYVPVRRLALFIEESLYRGTQWVVFEPNDEPLWAQIRLNVGAFMHNLFRQGAFQGRSPREAYLVKCDRETTTQNDINLGVVNILVGFAPLKPAEFVVIRIQQLAGQIDT